MGHAIASAPVTSTFGAEQPKGVTHAQRCIGATDGAAAVLAGPGGPTNTSALVFAGVSTATGVAIDCFLRGTLVGPGADVVLDEVDFTGSAR